MLQTQVRMEAFIDGSMRLGVLKGSAVIKDQHFQLQFLVRSQNQIMEPEL